MGSSVTVNHGTSEKNLKKTELITNRVHGMSISSSVGIKCQVDQPALMAKTCIGLVGRFGVDDDKKVSQGSREKKRKKKKKSHSTLHTVALASLHHFGDRLIVNAES
jgi:hypothetical protein